MKKKSQKMSYQKSLEQVPVEIRQKWEEEQNTLKAKLILEDHFDWSPDLKDQHGKPLLKYVRSALSDSVGWRRGFELFGGGQGVYVCCLGSVRVPANEGSV